MRPVIIFSLIFLFAVSGLAVSIEVDQSYLNNHPEFGDDIPFVVINSRGSQARQSSVTVTNDRKVVRKEKMKVVWTRDPIRSCGKASRELTTVTYRANDTAMAFRDGSNVTVSPDGKINCDPKDVTLMKDIGSRVQTACGMAASEVAIPLNSDASRQYYKLLPRDKFASIDFTGHVECDSPDPESGSN